jgi:hypothetical protein
MYIDVTWNGVVFQRRKLCIERLPRAPFVVREEGAGCCSFWRLNLHHSLSLETYKKKRTVNILQVQAFYGFKPS